MPFVFEVKQLSTHKQYLMIFSGGLTDDDFCQFKTIFDQCLLNTPFGVVFDLRNVKSVDPHLIMKQAKYMKEYEKYAGKTLIATAILLDSTIIQGILNMLFTIKKPVAPNIIVSSVEDGEEFINDNAQLFYITKKKKSNTN